MIYAIIILSIILGISIYYNFKFAFILMQMEDAIEESLDVLDERYASVSKVLEIPLFFDSPQIRQVINDIQKSRDSILKVATKIGTLEGEINAEESGQENSKS